VSYHGTAYHCTTRIKKGLFRYVMIIGRHACLSCLHGGGSALGVGTRWAGCACSLQVWLRAQPLSQPPCRCTEGIQAA
jgi:hypothetical protein